MADTFTGDDKERLRVFLVSMMDGLDSAALANLCAPFDEAAAYNRLENPSTTQPVENRLGTVLQKLYPNGLYGDRAAVGLLWMAYGLSGDDLPPSGQRLDSALQLLQMPARERADLYDRIMNAAKAGGGAIAVSYGATQALRSLVRAGSQSRSRITRLGRVLTAFLGAGAAGWSWVRGGDEDLTQETVIGRFRAAAGSRSGVDRTRYK